MESRREDEIAAFVRSLRDRDSPYKTADPRRGGGFPRPSFRLTADAGDAVEDCLAEVWRRLLTDGRWYADHFPWGLRVVDDGFAWSGVGWDVLRSADSDVAEVQARIAVVEFRLTHPTLAPPPYLDEESEDDHERRELLLELGVYETIRRAVRRPDIWPLWQELVANREVPVAGSVRDGFVDLGIGQPAPGPLPEYDRRLLEGHPDTQSGLSPFRPIQLGVGTYNIVTGVYTPPAAPEAEPGAAPDTAR
ncbi:MAG TPA: hypothetical protein VGE74_24205 [Gemmata sp.]